MEVNTTPANPAHEVAEKTTTPSTSSTTASLSRIPETIQTETPTVHLLNTHSYDEDDDYDRIVRHDVENHYDDDPNRLPTNNTTPPNQNQNIHVDSSVDQHFNDEDEDEREYNEYIKKWKESPFAIGMSYTSWTDEKAICCLSTRLWLLNNNSYDILFCCCDKSTKQQLIQHQQQISQRQQQIQRLQPIRSNRRYHYTKNKSIIACTAWCCKYAPVARFGNMLILYQSVPESSSMNDAAPQHAVQPSNRYTPPNTIRQKRPKLHIVMGPYWMVALFFTFPVMLCFTFWTAFSTMPRYQVGIQFTWSLCSIIMILSFFFVACCDPGIQYRYRYPPQHRVSRMVNRNDSPANTNHADDSNHHNHQPDDEEWVWNDQAISYRRRTAKYDPECAVIIDRLDHVCPWTGTAVGKNNMLAFRIFCLFVCINIVYDLLLLANFIKQYQNA